MLAAFPLTTARDRRCWSHRHSQWASNGWRDEACTDEQVRQAYSWRKQAAKMVMRQRARLSVIHGGGRITFSWPVWIKLAFSIAFVCKCYVSCIAICLLFILLLLSPVSMIHLLIYKCLNSSPIACLLSSVLCDIVVCMIWHLCFCSICCCYHLLIILLSLPPWLFQMNWLSISHYCILPCVFISFLYEGFVIVDLHFPNTGDICSEVVQLCMLSCSCCACFFINLCWADCVCLYSIDFVSVAKP